MAIQAHALDVLEVSNRHPRQRVGPGSIQVGWRIAGFACEIDSLGLFYCVLALGWQDRVCQVGKVSASPCHPRLCWLRKTKNEKEEHWRPKEVQRKCVRLPPSVGLNW